MILKKLKITSKCSPINAVDGLLVMCSEYTQHSLDVLSGFSSVPMVVMDWGPNVDTDIIEDNSFTGGYIATKHLIDCGHKAIGLIAGELDKNYRKNAL